MPSIKDLKKRIGTVKNTQQTTRAMKMVSAAKLRRSQEAIVAHRPYARKIDGLTRRLAAQVKLLDRSGEATETSRLLFGTRTLEEGTKPRCLLVVVTSDRGLCGGFNSNVIKNTQRWLLANQVRYESVTLAFVGRKGNEFFKTKKVKVGPYFAEVGGKVTFLKARKLADSLKELYLSGDYDQVKIVYNEFKNAISQRTLVEDFLPVERSLLEGETVTTEEATGEFLIKPSPGELLGELIAKHFAIQTFRVMLESQAGEHGARMSAMENATKNAGEMIRKLTLQYNKQRQAGITKELLEIISGSEAQKG